MELHVLLCGSFISHLAVCVLLCGSDTRSPLLLSSFLSGVSYQINRTKGKGKKELVPLFIESASGYRSEGAPTGSQLLLSSPFTFPDKIR